MSKLDERAQATLVLPVLFHVLSEVLDTHCQTSNCVCVCVRKGGVGRCEAYDSVSEHGKMCSWMWVFFFSVCNIEKLGIGSRDKAKGV